MNNQPKKRRHILEPYTVNGHVVRYSVRLRQWIVDELRYFKTKGAALFYALHEADKAGQ